MTLETQAPQIDKRKFEQIYHEARQRIPLYAPEWTDYNESDPGIALLQLYAWLTESMLYEMNRIPARNYIKFLQLLNMELRPAQPAVAHLTFTARENITEDISIRERTPIAAQAADGGKLVIFETVSGMDLVRTPLAQVQVYDGSAFTLVTTGNEATNQTYRPFGRQAGLNSALYLGFKVPQSAANSTSPKKSVFPTQMNLRVFLPQNPQTIKAQQAIDDVQKPPIPPVTLQWEYLPEEGQRWRKLSTNQDESAAFTQEGYIQIEGPQTIQAMPLGKVTEDYYWLRCRLVSGAYPKGTVPEIAFIRPNVVKAENLSTVLEETVGRSDGSPRQFFTLQRMPVKADTLKLILTPPNQAPETNWELRDDLLASKSDSKHYTLDATTGVITFGDGDHGMIPVAGTEIVAEQYRYGGGASSNVDAGAINVPLGSVTGVDKVTNERPAVGGRDEQDIEELKREAPQRIRSRNRAVTVEDYTVLAKQAGGVRRAKALALTHPQHPQVEVAGAVTVVIVPDNKDMPPTPSTDLIKQVCAYLNNFRLLTTEVYVKAPLYQAIKVGATIGVQPYAAFDEVKSNVVKALNDYLNPQEWEFGAELYPTSLYSVILDVADVKTVNNLAVWVDEQPHEDLTKPVRLGSDMLLYGTNHDIVPQPYRDI